MFPFLGIDLLLKRTYAVLMDQMGQIIDERRISNEEVGTYLKEHVPKETYAVLEATHNWPFMYDLLSDHVDRVELAHPKELNLIAKAVIKNDPIDSKAPAGGTRQEIMDMLCCEWRSVSEVVEGLEGQVNQPPFSRHLKQLMDTGPVRFRHEGCPHLYTLNQEQFGVC